MAIVNEMGMEKLCSIMGSESESVSLAACHLLQVMFEALTQGMKMDVRGKDAAILPGEKIVIAAHEFLEHQECRILHDQNFKIYFCWVPGHCGVG